MLINMKGSIAWGGIIAVMIMASFLVVHMVNTGNTERTIVVNTGKVITFANKAFSFMKTFNSSLQFNAMRSAYDLGLKGGFDKTEIKIWTDSEPAIDELKQELIKKIRRNIPDDFEEVTWGSNEMEIIPGDSEFTITGYQIFILYDGVRYINVNNSFDQIINSSYFGLLETARSMFDNDELDFSENELENKYGYEFSKGTEYITIEDRNSLVPLKYGETGITINGQNCLCDYLKLKFKILPVA